MHRQAMIEYCPQHKGPTCFCLNFFGVIHLNSLTTILGACKGMNGKIT